MILDADVIIKGEKGSFNLNRWLASQTSEPLQIAAITVAELWHGVERATPPHRAAREHYVRTIIENIPVLPYTDATANEHARLWAKLEASGKMIGSYDLIVAATALEHGISVATFNGRHFSRVPGLKVIKPV